MCIVPVSWQGQRERQKSKGLNRKNSQQLPTDLHPTLFIGLHTIGKTLSSKNEKRKSQIGLIRLISPMILFATSAHGRRTDLPVQFAFALKLKDNKKNKKSWQRGNKTAANKSTLRMWLN